MKVYEAVYNKELNAGVYAISLVEDPAMEDHWIALKNQDVQLQFEAVDEKRKLLLGAVLIPDKKIIRKDEEGDHFAVTFSSETIGQLAHDFLKNGYQNNSTEEHLVELQDVSFVESWQVEDPKVDKSALYGKEYEKGTWVAMAHVSDDIYEKATNGTFNGFSIDALLGLSKLNFKSDNMTKSEFLDAFKELLKFSKEEPKKVEEIEVKSEEVAEEVTETETEPQKTEAEEEIVEVIEAPEMEVLANQLAEMKAEFSKQKEDAKKQVEDKDKEIEELKAQLNKEPEVEAIKPKLEVTEKVEHSTAATISGRVRENLQSLWNN